MKRGQKILKIVGIVFSIILETLAILLACSTRWMFRTWTNLSMDELVYHLTAPLEGTNTDMSKTIAENVLFRRSYFCAL